jgi:hypothetical protein
MTMERFFELFGSGRKGGTACELHTWFLLTVLYISEHQDMAVDEGFIFG